MSRYTNAQGLGFQCNHEEEGKKGDTVRINQKSRRQNSKMFQSQREYFTLGKRNKEGRRKERRKNRKEGRKNLCYSINIIQSRFKGKFIIPGKRSLYNKSQLTRKI